MQRCLALKTTASLAFAAMLVAGQTATAQQATPVAGPAPGLPYADLGAGSFLLTVFLRHDESKRLDVINEQLRNQGYYQAFPPPGIEVVSWYVVMGIGQVVTLRVPAERLRDVNRAIKQTAWGAFRTEFYPTYDYKTIAEGERGERR